MTYKCLMCGDEFSRAICKSKNEKITCDSCIAKAKLLKEMNKIANEVLRG